MVSQQIEARGITEPRVLAAMRTVPRHRFLPAAQAGAAYADRPVALARDQTISQPFVVAFMTAALQLQGTERVLEIGTGSGYQTAVLAECAGEVFSIELEPSLAHGAAHTLAELCYRNVRLRQGDGSYGWPEAGPFDAIALTAAPSSIPPALFEQLAVGGRLIAPVGGQQQELVLWTRGADGQLTRRPLLPVRFVRMRGAVASR
jgi:protein-L-isoaspartate(D-aspartate) O-methyltransferase